MAWKGIYPVQHSQSIRDDDGQYLLLNAKPAKGPLTHLESGSARETGALMCVRASKQSPTTIRSRTTSNFRYYKPSTSE